jgi:hypothetical protein
VLPSVRPSLLKPCENKITIKEPVIHKDAACSSVSPDIGDSNGESVFVCTKYDYKPGLSVEDRLFLAKMDNTFSKDDRGYWEAPLPVKEPRTRLPNNRSMATNHSRTFDASLHMDHVKRAHFIQFMQKLFDNDHAELAPSLQYNTRGRGGFVSPGVRSVSSA